MELTLGIKLDPVLLIILLFGICFVDANNGWVVGNTGNIWATTDGGTTWNQQGIGVNNQQLNAVFFLDTSHGWAVGNSGTILSYNGSTWTDRTGAVSSNFNGIYTLP